MLEYVMPISVFRYFEALCMIPHGSRNTKTISDFCVAFAESYHLEHWQDAANNVVIVSPASPGYENAETIILQGHLDMVCEKAPGASIDMTRDALKLRMDGDFVSAEGTTLGGDDGIAIAMMLAILQETNIPHPRLECVMTADEEIGMLGAAAFDASRLRGKRMINLDSEEEGVFTVGCAGGCTALCSFTPRWVSASGAGDAVHISIRGLTGGHSGIEIHKRRANANILLGRILQEAAKGSPLQLVRVGGGAKDNAIPVSADAELVTPEPLSLRRTVERYAEVLRREYAETDPGLTVEVTDSVAVMCMDADSTRQIIRFLSSAPDGVQSMSADLPGLVQTSLNLGILETAPEAVSASFCVRSSQPREKEELLERLRVLTESAPRRKSAKASGDGKTAKNSGDGKGAKTSGDGKTAKASAFGDALAAKVSAVGNAIAANAGLKVPDASAIAGQMTVSGDYPAWTYQPYSAMRQLCVEAFRDLYRTEPKIEAIHAGLECGYFADKIPGLDCVSIGPDILDIHTPRERMRISSVQRVWRFLLEVLQRAK